MLVVAWLFVRALPGSRTFRASPVQGFAPVQ